MNKTKQQRVQGARVPLYPYQERWVRDGSRFKIAVKATQIGYSFAAALEAVLDCLEHRTLWIVLSRGERQSLEFMQKARQHAEAMRIAGSKLDSSFFERTNIVQHEITFPNGSRIIGLPANPDTARGYTGNMILDEFAFHQQDREIWAAAFGRISRGGLKLRVISTPNGRRGKYYEVAKEAGLIDGHRDTETQRNDQEQKKSAERRQKCRSLADARDDSHLMRCEGDGENGRTAQTSCRGYQDSAIWSGHWCDVHGAVRQGCPINVAALRQAIGDEQSWQQEYECVFLAGSENYISLDLIAACTDPAATTALPAGWREEANDLVPDKRACLGHPRELYLGYDVARVRDLAVAAVVEKVGDVFWTRALLEMPKATFAAQERALRDTLPLCRRGAVDATGMGKQMAERLAAEFPGRVEAVTFNVARKQEMATRMRRHFEERTLRIPDNRLLRQDLNAVKRTITSAGNIRFDAERTDEGHADRFWALALALEAAERGRRSAFAESGIESEAGWYEAEERGSIYSAGMESAEQVGGTAWA